VLFMNEENGLRGAKAYSDAHAAELPRHVAAMEMNSGGGRPLGVQLRAGDGGAELVQPWLAPLAALSAGSILTGEAGGADLSPLVPAQVPMFGVRTDASRYFDYHHTHADTLDKVEPEALAKSTAAVAWMTYAMAEMPGLLARPTAPPKAPSLTALPGQGSPPAPSAPPH
jgi:carboxypeptidase Q